MTRADRGVADEAMTFDIRIISKIATPPPVCTTSGTGTTATHVTFLISWGRS